MTLSGPLILAEAGVETPLEFSIHPTIESDRRNFYRP
jgi:hypothetical protein